MIVGSVEIFPLDQFYQETDLEYCYFSFLFLLIYPQVT